MTSALNLHARKAASVDTLKAAFHEWNTANDPFANFREQLDSGEDVILPELVGLLMSDMVEYRRLMRQAFKAGYSIQRHPCEQFGIQGTTPMLVRKGA